MELRQLEYFRAIVDAGTISGAARMLHMTQPPLSYQLKMLEEELQVPLLVRGTKKITLTEAGKTLYEQAGTLLMLADLTKREVVKSSQAATLHIGMTPSTVSLLSDYLLRFSKQHPQVHFDVHEGSTFALKDQLENHVIDLTTLRTPIVLNGCETKTLLKESITAMALPDHPLFAERDTLSLTELAEQPLILSNRYRKYMLLRFRTGRSVLRHLSDLRGCPHGNDDGGKRAWHCSSARLHAAAFPSIKGLRHHGRRPYNGNPARLAQRAPSIRASGFFKNVE